MCNNLFEYVIDIIGVVAISIIAAVMLFDYISEKK
jgi:hypothetical protein